MSKMYGAHHRALQDRFDTRRLADRVEELAVHAEINQDDREFIESRDMFFLATIDHQGRPSCSYKGGAPGFVRVLDSRTIAFPSLDGNGMFFSMGNIAANASVGMLFIDFEHPNRLRLHGSATIDVEDPLLMEYPRADLIVRVTVSELFPNCPRYVHPYHKVAQSRYVPVEGCDTPLATWKRIDLIQDDLPEKDQGKAVEAGGLITMDEYFAKLKAGEA